MSYYDPGPQVTGIYPARYDTDISTSDLTFQVVYDQAVLDSSVDSEAIALINLSTNAEVEVANIIVSYKTVTFEPATTLTSSTRYQVVMKDTIQSLDGVASGRTFVWEFTTAAASLSAPELTSPANQSSLVTTATPTAPTFVWEAVSGAHHYDIQVSTDSAFSTTYWPVGAYDPTETTVSPSSSFTTGMYYWRVRAVAVVSPSDESDYGDWSDVWSFYVGQEEIPHYQSQVLIDPEARKFYVTSVSPTVGDSHIQATSWTITFNHVVDPAYVNSTYFVARKHSNVGIPSSAPALDGTFSVSSNTVVFTPAAAELESGTSYFAYNTEYSMSISKQIKDTSGNRLRDDTVAWFSSYYNPLYLDWTSIRIDLGEFADDIPVDLINRFIHMSSLEVNRMGIALPSTVGSSSVAPTAVTVAEVLGQAQTVVNPFDVMTYVRARTEWMILQRRRFEFIETIDTRRILGSFSVAEAPVRLLEEIKRMMDELKAICDQLSLLLGTWSLGYGKAIWAQKSASFWYSSDYAKIIVSRTTGGPVPIYNYGQSPSCGYVSRYGNTY